eukprot:10005030-Lingulodinium_polyedra.AAC.1
MRSHIVEEEAPCLGAPEGDAGADQLQQAAAATAAAPLRPPGRVRTAGEPPPPGRAAQRPVPPPREPLHRPALAQPPAERLQGRGCCQ